VTTVRQLLCLGDDALIAAQRLSQWCTRAPEMEEDVALANIALDQLGAARLLLGYAGELEAAGRDEDALAFLRSDAEFHNALLTELPDRDFAVMIAKLLFLAAYQLPLYQALAAGEPLVEPGVELTADQRGTDPVAEWDERLAGIAGKAAKESAYHLDHAHRWTVRLGDGTAESHARMQAAVDEVWPYTHELFATAPGRRAGWLAIVEPVLTEATLRVPADGWAPSGGREGRHTEALSYLLGEMQVLHRAHPGARW
jgi:ring-1,2-phenylacetyl-CoA epoxidase subunit PaaC